MEDTMRVIRVTTAAGPRGPGSNSTKVSDAKKAAAAKALRPFYRLNKDMVVSEKTDKVTLLPEGKKPKAGQTLLPKGTEIQKKKTVFALGDVAFIAFFQGKKLKVPYLSLLPKEIDALKKIKALVSISELTQAPAAAEKAPALDKKTDLATKTFGDVTVNKDGKVATLNWFAAKNGSVTVKQAEKMLKDLTDALEFAKKK
jgi:hypothetical protein